MSAFLLALSWAGVFTLGTLVAEFGNGRGIGALLHDYLPAIATLLAAYVGANQAFKLDRYKEAERDSKANVEAGNRAMITLSRQMSRIMNLKEQFIDPHRTNAARHFAIRPVTMHWALPEIDIDSLSFLINEDPNILGELSTIQETVFNSILMFKTRSERIINEVQPKLEAGGFRHGESPTVQQVKEILGERIVGALKEETDATIKLIDIAANELPQRAELLSAALKKMFPQSFVIKFDKPILRGSTAIKP